MRQKTIEVKCDNDGCSSRIIFLSTKDKVDTDARLKKNGWLVGDYKEYCCNSCRDLSQENCPHEHDWVHLKVGYAVCTECDRILAERP